MLLNGRPCFVMVSKTVLLHAVELLLMLVT
jgi:hypothetical protein